MTFLRTYSPRQCACCGFTISGYSGYGNTSYLPPVLDSVSENFDDRTRSWLNFEICPECNYLASDIEVADQRTTEIIHSPNFRAIESKKLLIGRKYILWGYLNRCLGNLVEEGTAYINAAWYADVVHDQELNSDGYPDLSRQKNRNRSSLALIAEKAYRRRAAKVLAMAIELGEWKGMMPGRAEVIVADLYRRSEQWEKAQKFVEASLEKEVSSVSVRLLSYELWLIKEHDSAEHDIDEAEVQWSKVDFSISRSLDLSHSTIRDLGKCLVINGSLDLSHSDIQYLPKHLTVHGNLDLSYTSIKSLPKGISIGGNLNLHSSNIRSLPKNFSVHGDIDLSRTPIQSLPNNFSLGGSLNLSNSPIQNLGNCKAITGSLDLSHSSIQYLPVNLSVGGYLNVSDTPLKSLPEELFVRQGVDFGGTSIREWPESVFIQDFIWRGVPVPEWVISTPERISPELIFGTKDIYLRRALIDRYGLDRFFKQSKPVLLSEDEYGKLWRLKLKWDQPFVMVEVANSTPEPDGSVKTFFIRVPRGVKTAKEAVAWTFDMKVDEYAPTVET